jgi:hypothetical protein
MRLLLKTASTNPEYDGDCRCAVLDLTPERVAQITAHVKVARQAAEASDALWELYFRGDGSTFHAQKLIDACDKAAGGSGDVNPGDWERRLQEKGLLRLPDGVDLERFEAQPTECDQQIVRCQRAGGRLAFEIAWTASPKHTDLYVTTEAIPWDKLLLTTAFTHARAIRIQPSLEPDHGR